MPIRFLSKKITIYTMKKILLIMVPIVALCAIGFFCLSNETEKTVSRKAPFVLSMTKSVEIPKEVTFAGEKLDLDRYDMHERYDRELNSFTYFHSTTLMLIKRANRFFPIIEPILKENNIPDDFKYLAVIESNLDPRAYSPAKAVGLWQFMPATGKQFGLEVGAEVDERYHVEKATYAACKYLHQAHRKYGSWASVALSYNGGQGRISGELNKQQAEEGLDLWLVEETARYYFRMAAIKQIFENPSKYGFVLSADQLYKPMTYKDVKVSSTITDLASFAVENNVTYAQLKDANSWLRDRKLTILAGKSYTLQIPTQESLYYSKEAPKVHNKAWVTLE